MPGGEEAEGAALLGLEGRELAAGALAQIDAGAELVAVRRVEVHGGLLIALAPRARARVRAGEGKRLVLDDDRDPGDDGLGLDPVLTAQENLQAALDSVVGVVLLSPRSKAVLPVITVVGPRWCRRDQQSAKRRLGSNQWCFFAYPRWAALS